METPADPSLLQDTIASAPLSFGGQALQMFFSLGVLIAILFGLLYLSRYLFRKRHLQLNAASPIKILEQRTIGPKSRLYLIEVLDKVVCVAESPHGWTTLTETSKDKMPPEVHEEASPSKPSFASILSRKKD